MTKFIIKRSILFAGSVYAILLILYFSQFHYGLSQDRDNWGTFGDFLGGSLSPIVGIITVILTYDIIKNQTTQDRQSEFKYIFEILFRSLDENKKLISYTDTHGVIFRSREALKLINKDIESSFRAETVRNPEKTVTENITAAFWGVFEEIEGSSSTYMKNLHNCLKIIDLQCLEANQESYSSLVRAQLNDDDMRFVLYNALSHSKFKSFKMRIEKYSMLKDLETDKEISSLLKNLYEKSAFKETRVPYQYQTISFYRKTWGFDIKFNFGLK